MRSRQKVKFMDGTIFGMVLSLWMAPSLLKYSSLRMRQPIDTPLTAGQDRLINANPVDLKGMSFAVSQLFRSRR